MKVNVIHELLDFPPFRGYFLGNKAIVYVSKSYGKIEKHAFPIDENQRLVMFDKRSNAENPKVKGNFVYDDNNRVLLKYKDGDDYAYPLDAHVDMRELISSKDRAVRMFYRGLQIGRDEVEDLLKKNRVEDKLVMAAGIIVVVTVISALLNYFAFDALGVGLFSDPTQEGVGVICRNVEG